VKRAIAMLALVFAVPMLQGALGPFLPAVFRPDLALLVVFALSLSWRNTASGLVLSAVCGFFVDLFSGALFGQNALMSVLMFAAARALSVHVSMIGALPQVIFAASLTVVHALGLTMLTTFFTPASDFALLRPALLGPRVLANAVVAPAVGWVVSVLVAWVSGEDVGRRPLRIATRSWVP
jgi:cell shape-determining protein MreD